MTPFSEKDGDPLWRLDQLQFRHNWQMGGAAVLSYIGIDGFKNMNLGSFHLNHCYRGYKTEYGELAA